MAVIVFVNLQSECGSSPSEDVLRRAGCDVLVVTRAEEAVALAEDNRLALIVLRACGTAADVSHACRTIRSHALTRRVPVLVMTRVDDIYTRDQLVRAGATAILVEPPRPALLLRQLRRLTRRDSAASAGVTDQPPSTALEA